MDGLYRALVADDELPSRHYLCELVKQDKRFELVAACDSGQVTVIESRKLKPDVLFLDIQMPGMDGIQVVESMQEQSPLVVFVTAHSNYAIRAFELAVFDYVKKPVDPDRFTRVMQRVHHRLVELRASQSSQEFGATKENQTSASTDSLDQDQKLLKAVRQEIVYRERDIDFIESASNYINVHILGESHLVRESLDSFCSQLHSRDFVRVHRSFVVNIRCVTKMRYGKSGSAELDLAGGHVIPVSRSRRKEVTVLLRSLIASSEIQDDDFVI